jgi:enduracididine biosynthesis enzyme MppP
LSSSFEARESLVIDVSAGTALSGTEDLLCAVGGNLTELERTAIVSGVNVADGHARYPLTPAQQAIVARLPELFDEAARAPEAALDREAQAAFLSALGQHAALTEAEVLSCYSSSVALEILGRALYADGLRRVALVHPTFDSIPDILRGVGMQLIPAPEERLFDGSFELPPATDVLLVTTPNNPTGRVLDWGLLEYWAARCAERGVVLVLDTSFRGFDRRAQYDHVEVLVRSGCRYVLIEDSGKLWPTLDLKVGLLVFPPGDPLPLHRIYTDILLRVSPLILLLIRRFAEDAVAGGFADLHALIAGNRSLLERHLAGAAALADPDSRISVARLDLPPEVPAGRLWSSLQDRDVHVLPCGQFHWADHEGGERYVRVALSRDPADVVLAAAAIRDELCR